MFHEIIINRREGRKTKKYIFPSDEAKNRISNRLERENSFLKFKREKGEEENIYDLPSDKAKNRI